MRVCGKMQLPHVLKAVKPAIEDGNAHCFLAFQCAQLKPKSKPSHFLGAYK